MSIDDPEVILDILPRIFDAPQIAIVGTFKNGELFPNALDYSRILHHFHAPKSV
jgi:hypothetical protein